MNKEKHRGFRSNERKGEKSMRDEKRIQTWHLLETALADIQELLERHEPIPDYKIEYLMVLVKRLNDEGEVRHDENLINRSENKKPRTIDEILKEGERIRTCVYDSLAKLFMQFLTDTGDEGLSQRDLIIAEKAMKMGISLYSEATGAFCKAIQSEETKVTLMTLETQLDRQLKRITTNFISELLKEFEEKSTEEKINNE
jgi:hypothetical protein